MNSIENVWNSPAIISPSLISCCDMCNLERDIRILEKAGIEILHIDILDGHFSPSMPLGLDAVKRIGEITDMKLDVHLMSTNNSYFIEELIKMKVAQIVFHIETESHVDGMLNRIHSAGIRAGVALKPETSLVCLDYISEKCDAVLLMLINPGYASSKGESQVPYASKKILDLQKMRIQQHAHFLIELDGRISKNDILMYKSEGMLYVAGSTCLNREILEESMIALMEFRKHTEWEGK